MRSSSSVFRFMRLCALGAISGFLLHTLVWAKEDTATVLRVIDGDTIEVSVVEKVRLIGVETPETVDPRKPIEVFGREASEVTWKLVKGKKVVMRDEIGHENRDKYGRLFRYVYLH